MYGYCDATYKDKMNEEETVTFVKNSKSAACGYEYLRRRIADPELRIISSFPGHEPRWVVGWLCTYVRDQEGRCEEDLYPWERVASVSPSRVSFGDHVKSQASFLLTFNRHLV